MEKQLRCKDCKWIWSRWVASFGYWYCTGRGKVNPGQFACKKFVYKDK